jgi:uncharacterized protein
MSMADGLDAPLGQKKSRARLKSTAAQAARGLNKLPTLWISLGLLALVVSVPAVWIIAINDPQGGRPSTEVLITPASDLTRLASELSAPTADSGPPEAETVDISAVQKPVPQPETGTGQTGSEGEAGQAPLEVAEIAPENFGALEKLSEQTQRGVIPRIALDGTRPMDAYARASMGQAGAAGRPRIALVVTGLGLADQSTRQAIATLPDNVTLAFAPYGKRVAELAMAARADGHEIMLSVPMEPFDYPQNDPGPQTLLTGQPARANLDRLFWLMSRIGAYTGLINHLGARFTASAVDFGPMMEEIGLRGLSYLDDGSSSRSLARQLAGDNRIAFGQADGTLDNVPTRKAILGEFKRLEQIATETGQAIGVGSALPITVRMIAEWASTAEKNGFLLVPASALTVQAN